MIKKSLQRFENFCQLAVYYGIKITLCFVFSFCIIHSLEHSSEAISTKIDQKSHYNDTNDLTFLPVKDFMKKAKFTQIKIDPSGKYIAYRYENDGFANIYVARFSSESMEAIYNGEVVGNKISNAKDIRIKNYRWSGNDILYVVDKEENENTSIYCIKNAKNKPILYKIGDKKNVQHILLYSDSNLVFFASNARDKTMMDLYIWNKKTHKKHKIFHNDQGFYNFHMDSNLNFIILEKRNNETAKVEYWKYNLRSALKNYNKDLKKNNIITLSKNLNRIEVNGSVLFCNANYVYSYIDSKKPGINGMIVKKHIKYCNPNNYHRYQMIFYQKNKKSTVDNIIFTEGKICGVRTYYAKEKWHTRKCIRKVQNIVEEYAKQNHLVNPEWHITSNNNTNRYFTCLISASNKQPESYIIDLKSKNKIQQITRVFDKNYKFAITEAVLVKARDEMQILCYVTKPSKFMANNGKFPLIVLIHGGPEARDYMTFCRITQFLVSRGYAVLKVNYRGSDGLGEAFRKAGNGEWAEKSYYDVVDAVKFFQSTGWVEKVCIMGGSYGGYQTLIGCWKNPEIFSCGIDICGPSDMVTLVESVPPYLKVLKSHLWRLILNPSIVEENKIMFEKYKKQIDQKSPLNKPISVPLLIVQGKNDPRVKEEHSRKMYKNLIKNNRGKNQFFIYLLFKNEGHAISHQENLQYMMIVIEYFLSKVFAFEKNIFEIPQHVRPKNAILKYKVVY